MRVPRQVPTGEPEDDDDVRAAHPHQRVPAGRDPSTPIYETVLAGAAARGDHPALVDGVTGQTITYAQLAQMVERMAAGFAEIGVQPGRRRRAAQPEHRALPGRLLRRRAAPGATVTTLSALATAKDMANQLDDSKAEPGGHRRRAAAGGASRRPATGRCGPATSVEGHRSVQELLASTGPVPEVQVDAAEDVAVLPYSSGTTSLPKGVMLTHASIGVNLRQIAALRPDDAGGPDHRRPAVLPHLRHDGADEPAAAGRRHGGRAAAVRPRAVPDGARAGADHQGLRGPAGGRRLRQAPGRGRARPVGGHLDRLRRRAAGRRGGRDRRGAAGRARSPRPTG